MILVFPYLKEKLKSQKVETHVIVLKIPARIWKCKNISPNLKGKKFKTWHLQKVINFKHDNHTLTPHPRWSITPRLRVRQFSLSDSFPLLLEDCTATPYVTGAQAHCAAGHRRLAPRSVANHAYIRAHNLTLKHTTQTKAPGSDFTLQPPLSVKFASWILLLLLLQRRNQILLLPTISTASWELVSSAGFITFFVSHQN